MMYLFLYLLLDKCFWSVCLKQFSAKSSSWCCYAAFELRLCMYILYYDKIKCNHKRLKNNIIVQQRTRTQPTFYCFQLSCNWPLFRSYLRLGQPPKVKFLPFVGVGFPQGGRPLYHPINSIKALKDGQTQTQL